MSEDPNVIPEPNYDTPPADGTPPPLNGTDVPPTRPLPLDEAIRQLPDQYIKVLTQPGARVFALEQGKAAWDIIWAQIVILIVINILMGQATFNTTLPEALVSSHLSNQMIQMVKTFSSPLALISIIFTLISFFIGMGVYSLIAKAFGGRGTFVAYSYSYLLLIVPLNLIRGILIVASSALGLPFSVGPLAAIAVSIYQIVPQIFMTMGIHRLSGGKATLVVLLTPIILCGLFLGLAFVAAFILWVSHHAPSALTAFI